MPDPQSINIQGSLIAIRSTLSFLLANSCKEHPAALDHLYSILTDNIEVALDKVRGLKPEDSGAVDQLEAASIRELDDIFTTSKAILKRSSPGS